MKAKELLIKMNACPKAIQWVANKSVKEAWESCPYGDWMLWFAVKLQADKKKLFLAKSIVAHQSVEWMENKKSRDAVRAAFLYGKGKKQKEYLEMAAAAIMPYDQNDPFKPDNPYDHAFNSAFAAVSSPSLSSLFASSAAASTAAVADAAASAAASYAASAIDATNDSTAAARKKSLSKSADICRKILTDEICRKL